MGINSSKICLTLFEIVNELYTAVGAGVLGIFILFHHGFGANTLFRTFVVSSITTGSLLYVFNTSDYSIASKNKLIFITGCDSGLGFSIAQHACEMGFTVLAGCLNLNSQGAKILKTKCTNIEIIELDVKSVESVTEAISHAAKMVVERDYVLWAVINNAGVMVFGEFEWQTERLIQQQMDVNLIGTMRVTKAFCPLLRLHKARLINVSSHCAFASLPGLAVYGATKAGIQAFSDAIRVELSKYGVKVVTLIPGSFVMQSNIMANHVNNVYEMKSRFSPEQELFYGSYFMKYNTYLNSITGPIVPTKLDDPELYVCVENALLEKQPKALYINEPWKYSMYHKIFRFGPTCVRDYFVNKFVQMPEYEPPGNFKLDL